MTTIKVYLDKRSLKRDGTAPLKIRVYRNAETAFIPLGISLKPETWDESKNIVIKRPDRNSLNSHISVMKSKYDMELMRMEQENLLYRLPVTSIRDILVRRVNGDEDAGDDSTLFVKIFEKFIARKDKKRTIETYRATLTHIHKFCDTADFLAFEDVTREWLFHFDKYLAKTSPSRNARNIHLCNIRAVFNYAIDEEITTSYPFRKFKIKKEETIKRSLSVEKLRELFTFPVEDNVKKYQDMFKLIFLLIGINTVDLCALKEVRDGRIEYRRAKTSKLYSIKVEPEAMEIIKKYRGIKKLLYMADKYEDHHDYMRRLNENLRRIGTFTRTGQGGKKTYTPICPGITSYWARHSWATIASSLDIPKETIAAALGHSMGNPTTAIYINFDQRKVDEANRKVIDWVFYNK